MDEQQRGNFYAPQNRYKQPGSNQPDFRGKLSLPGREGEFGISLWTGRYDSKEVDPVTGAITQKTYISGLMNPAPVMDDVMAQVDALSGARDQKGETITTNGNLTLRPYQLVLFANKFRAPEASDTPEQAEKRKNRPHYWGRLNPGDGTPEIALSVWAQQSEYGSDILLVGATAYPQPGKTLEMAAGEAEKGDIPAERKTRNRGRAE